MAVPITSNANVNNYVDFSYLGFASSPSLAQVYPFVLRGIDAIKNVVKMYLMSQKEITVGMLQKGDRSYPSLGNQSMMIQRQRFSC